jgi:hypothetical protein
LDFIEALPTDECFDMILTMADLMGADVQITTVHSDDTAEQTALVLFNE